MIYKTKEWQPTEKSAPASLLLCFMSNEKQTDLSFRCASLHLADLLKAGVVPGVLKPFHVKRVLNHPSTARTVTIIWKRQKKTKLSRKDTNV